MADGEPKLVSREEARRLVEDGAQLLDVRTDHEWETGHIEGATHIDLPELPDRVGEIDSARRGGAYAPTATRGLRAAPARPGRGYDGAKMDEGVLGWSEAGLPLVPEDGYVAESGDAAAVLEQRKRAAQSGS